MKLKLNDLPRKVIHELSEDLLIRFDGVSLLSRYDVYQRLMDYWAETMQDDVYLIAAESWMEAAKPRAVIEDKERQIKETPDLVVKRKKYKMDLIPPALIVARYFAAEQVEVDSLQAEAEAATATLDEYTEEHGVEEGLLEEALNDKGKVTQSGVKDRLKAIEDDDSEDERAALVRCLELMDADAEAKSKVKENQEKLDEQTLSKYKTLSEAEIKSITVDDKWFTTIQRAVEGEVNRVTQLSDRVRELDERYADALPEVELMLRTLSGSVEKHLQTMGLSRT